MMGHWLRLSQRVQTDHMAETEAEGASSKDDICMLESNGSLTEGITVDPGFAWSLCSCLSCRSFSGSLSIPLAWP